MIFSSIEFGSEDYRKECALRDRVLRAPLGLRLADEDLNVEQEQEHFGLFDDARNLVACAIVVQLSPAEAKIRQMAVSGANQRQGHGQYLMRSLESRLAALGCQHVFLHARTSVVGFYEKLGYTRIGDEFTEVGIPHIRMEKRL